MINTTEAGDNLCGLKRTDFQKVIDGKEVLRQAAEDNQLCQQRNDNGSLSGKLGQLIFNLQQHVPILLMHIRAGHGM